MSHFKASVLIAGLVMFSAWVFAAPYDGQIINLMQPDGTIVEVKGYGDEFYGRFESLDGYTLVYDSCSGNLVYAQLSEDASEFIPTDVVYDHRKPTDPNHPSFVALMHAREKFEEKAGGKSNGHGPSLLKHLNLNKQVIRQKKDQKRKALGLGLDGLPVNESGQESPEAIVPEAAAASTEHILGLTILVDFSDCPGVDVTPSEVDDFCNLNGYNGNGNNGSIRDYFYDISGGMLDYTNVVTVYVRAPYTKAYYEEGGDGDCTDGYGYIGQLVKDAIEGAIDLGYDFSSLTREDPYNRVKCLNIFYAGGTDSCGWANGLWPHRSSINNYTASDGTVFHDYQMSNIGTSLTIGTFCHENGHMMMNWSDYYDYGTDGIGSRGLGNYCLMSSGSFSKNPLPPNAYCRVQSGWLIPTVMNDMLSGTVLTATEDPFDLSVTPVCYKYENPGNSNECFLIENCQRNGRRVNIPDQGLMIWHVDTSSGTSNNYQDMTPERHYKVSIEQADGLFHLEYNINSGGSNDLFHAGYKDTFDDTTLPDAKWWSGSNSGLLIHGISALGSTMNFIYGILENPTPPVAVDVNEFTQIDTPVTITLSATDEGLPSPPSALSYIITSQPTHGWLAQPETPAIPIGSVPYILVGNTVIYTPRFGCEHPTSFTYVANDGGTAPDGGDSNEAAVTISFEAEPVTLYTAMMDTDPGWTLEGDWAWGTPAGQGGDRGNPDPASGYTATNVVGYNLNGDYPTSLSPTQWAMTPAIDCKPMTAVQLSFYRWLNVDSYDKDQAVIEASSDGINWTRIWQNDSKVTDNSWTLQTFDISAVADGQPTVYIRWGMGPTNNNQNYSGWNIDDVTITGQTLPTPPMVGDFEPDCDVDVYDLIHVVSYWLAACGDCDGTDLITDGIINLADFQALAQNWLPLADDYIMDFRWPFDTDASDIISGYDGTLMNGASIDTSDPAVGTGALLLDGVDDYVNIPGFKGITGTASRTCMGWVKTTAASKEILTWGSEEGNGYRWIIRINEGGQLRAEVQGGNIIGTTVINDGTWHHITVVLDNDGSPDITEARLYVDGLPETISASVDERVYTGSIQNVQIGVYNPAQRYFQGLIDDVRIYNRALSEQEIAEVAQ